MKTSITTVFLLFFSIQILAQAPLAFNYQGVARDLSGNTIPDQNLGIQITILQGSTNGTEVYKETHTVTSNNFGLFTLQIGNGNAANNPFSEIGWENGIHFLQIEIDENGGNNYQLIGTSQLISVPYALFAESSGNNVWNVNSNGIDYIDGNIGIGTDTPNNLVDIKLGNTGSLFQQGVEINRNDGFLRMINGTSVSGDFQPRISGLADSDLSPGLTLVGTPSTSNSNSRGIILRAGETSPMLNGNILEIDNFTTTYLSMDFRGFLGIGTDTPNNLVDINLGNTGSLFQQGVEINRNDGFLRMINGTSVSGDFQPRISGLADSDLSPGLTLVGTPSTSNSNSRGIILRAGETSPMLNGNILEIDNFTTTHMSMNYQGFVGIGTTEPKSKLQVTDGDIYIDDINKGIIMKSPDGQCWRYTPDNQGALMPTAITCPN